MTATEKILARASGNKTVSTGDNIWVNVDILMTHDVCGPGTIGVFKREFGEDARVWDNNKIVIIPDHYIFTEDQKAHRNVDILREFAGAQGIQHYFDVGTDRYQGVCHVALAQRGFTRPGEVLFGTDSHTCTAGAFGEFATGIGNTDAGFIMGTGKLLIKVPETMRFQFNGEMPHYLLAKDLILQVIGDIGMAGATYRAMEFTGETLKSLNMEERMTLTNMVVEAGGKNGFIEADEATFEYLKGRDNYVKNYEPATSDKDARFYFDRRYDVSKLEPVVAKPHSPDNLAGIREVAGTKIDRAYIGSCTGGKLFDFINAAKILYGNKVTVPTYVVPSTVDVKKGIESNKVNDKLIVDIFNEAGCNITLEPSCAACLGGPVDTFGRMNEPEVCVSTTNRNFPGRMGDRGARIYLASPYTAAASAIKGALTDPREFL